MRAILASLGAFLSAGFRPGHPLARAITIMLLIKVMVLIIMKTTWFDAGGPETPPILPTHPSPGRTPHGA